MQIRTYKITIVFALLCLSATASAQYGQIDSNDSVIIRKYVNDTLNFRMLKEDVGSIHWRYIGSNLDEREFDALYERYSKKQIKNIRNAAEWLCFNLYKFDKYMAFQMYLLNPKYKRVKEGYVISGERKYATDIAEHRKYTYQTTDTYFVGFDKKGLLIQTNTEKISNKYRRPPQGDVSIDTTSITYEFSEENYRERAFAYPDFTGGKQELVKMVKEKLPYPEIAMEYEAQGKVILSFTIQPDGSFSDMEIVRRADPIIDREVLQFVKTMQGKWIPGTLNGEDVPVKVNLTIQFTLRW